MVCLTHFDVCNQVSACARVLDVGHRDHKVIEGNSLCFFSSAYLARDDGKSYSLSQTSEHHALYFYPHFVSLGPAADLQSLAFVDGHLEGGGDPNVPQILGSSVEGEALHAADLLPAVQT